MALIFGTNSQPQHLRPRLFVAFWLLGFFILFLWWRLYQLQVMRGEEMLGKGRRNFVQRVRVLHDRGIIYDRNGVILVDNRPSINLTLTPAFVGKGPVARKSIDRLTDIFHWEADDKMRVERLFTSVQGLQRFRPIVIQQDLSLEQVEAIESDRSLFLLNGIDTLQGRRRTYPFGTTAAHLLGYVNEIDSATLEEERLRGNPMHYDLGDMIGREGVERVYEKILRGVDGQEYSIVDAQGRRQATHLLPTFWLEQEIIKPVPGHNVYLTIDIELQQTAEKIFQEYGKAGSVVAVDPRTGEILVLASLPSFDINNVGSMFRGAKLKIDQNPLKPWLNRSIAGQYVPGSTFKVVTALAGLDQNVLQNDEKLSCPGNFRLGRHTWRCWKHAGHGAIDLKTALQRSCDVFFYQLGQRLGLDPIAAVAQSLGFGQRSEILLMGETPGLVPTEAYHKHVDAATGGYQKGMSINTSIGQGALMVTPLQLAMAYAAIANGHQLLRPQLALRTETADYRLSVQQKIDKEDDPSAGNGSLVAFTEGAPPKILRRFLPHVRRTLTYSAEHIKLVQDGLYAAASLPGGTSYAHRSKLVSMVGKTGTAQVVRLGKERLKVEEVDYEERDHAWFVGYAPAESPEIVVAVLNEHAGHGGSAAAPIAVGVIEAYFKAKAAISPQSTPESGK